MYFFRVRSGAPTFPAANFAQLIDSITGKLWPLGDDVAFVLGHGPDVDFRQPSGAPIHSFPTRPWR